MQNQFYKYLGVAALALLVYANSLDNPFQYDDMHSIADNPHIRDPANIPAFFVDARLFSASAENAMYRPLLLTTYALNYQLSGAAVWSYHVLSMGLHAGCALLVVACGRRLPGGGGAAPWLAGLVFALHPVHSEAVNYISSRSEVLCALYFLLAFHAFLRRRAEGGQLARVGLYFGAGLLCKSVAIVLPAAILAYDLLFARRDGRRDGRLYALLAATGLAYVAAVWNFLHRATLGEPVRSYSEQVWTQVKAMVFYLKLLLWPRGLSVDHQFLVSDTLLDPFAGLAALFLGSLVFFAWRERCRYPLALFLMAWFFLVLAPSSLVPLNVLVNEHRLYLPGVAFAWAAGLALARLGSRGGLVPVVAAGLVLFYAGGTWERNRIWGSARTLWADAASRAPLMARPYLFLGEALAEEGRAGEAMAAFERALVRDPSFAPGYGQLGRLYLEAGRVGEAEAALRAGLGADAESAGLWSLLAEVLRAQERWTESLQALQRAVALEPGDADLRNNLGNTYQVLEEPAKALEEHLKALEIDPEDARTWVNLGNARLMSDQAEAALEAYERAVALAPDYAGAWANLGGARERLGRGAAAMEAYAQAARLDGRYAELAASRRRALEQGGP